MRARLYRWASLIAILFAGSVPMAPPTWGVSATSGPLVVTPDPLDFGTVTLGQTRRLDLTVRNATSSPLTVIDVAAQPSVFSVAEDGCDGKGLNANAICTVEVEFRAEGATTYTGSISFVTTAGTTSAILRAAVAPVNATTTTTLPGPTTTTLPVSTVPTTTPPGPTTSRTDGTVPTTTTTLPRSDKERLDECERRAKDAKVSFEPRREMVVGETSQVRVTASIQDDGSFPTTTITVTVPTTIVPARLRCVVQARLGGLDFTIKPGDFQEKSFLDDPVITWSWDVRPDSRGDKTLTVELRSVARVEGRDIPGAAEPFYATIQVSAQPEGLGGKIRRWTGNVVEYPLVSGFGSLALVVGTLAAGWRWLLKRPWPWIKG